MLYTRHLSSCLFVNYYHSLTHNDTPAEFVDELGIILNVSNHLIKFKAALCVAFSYSTDFAVFLLTQN